MDGQTMRKFHMFVDKWSQPWITYDFTWGYVSMSRFFVAAVFVGLLGLLVF